jgi:uncharacterized protein (TIGR02466 family)
MLTLTETPLFVTSCYSTYLTGVDHKNIISCVEQIENTVSGRNRSNSGGYQSGSYTNYDNQHTALLFEEHIIPAVQHIGKEWGLPSILEKKNYWYNVNRKYTFNWAHVHPQSYISGVFYLQVPNSSGSIVFERSTTETDRMSFITDAYIDQQTGINNTHVNTQHVFAPSAGLLILFPGHLSHYVSPNITDEPDDRRISLSFNFF